jgi:hypothetical protein
MTALALGCSHTFGVGVDSSECYVSLLEKYYNTSIINTARPGGNAQQCLQQLVEHLRVSSPEFVIAQWPNPFRRTTWFGNRGLDENIHKASAVFNSLLAASSKNFMEPWLQCIYTADTLCKLSRTKVIHILFEDLEPEYTELIKKHNVVLHQDLKLPGQTWLFDSAGSDNLHHSATCHAQWAERLTGLLNETT